MKLQAVVILSLVATISAAPNSRFRRASDSNSTAVDCGSGSPTGLGELLSQLGTLLSNVLFNVEKIRIAGVLGGSGDLINLTDILEEVRRLVTTLLGGSGPSSDSASEGQVASLIGQITNLLDRLLGNGTGENYACSGGLVGNLVGNLGDTLLGPLLPTILNLVNNILGNLL